MNKKRIILALAIGFFGSILGILLFYIEYDLVLIDFNLALSRFRKWPWFSGIAILTFINYLIPFCAIWFHPINKSDNSYLSGLILYALVTSSIGVLIIYPGTEALEIWSDSNLYLAYTVIAISQCVFSDMIGSELIKNKGKIYESDEDDGNFLSY